MSDLRAREASIHSCAHGRAGVGSHALTNAVGTRSVGFFPGGSEEYDRGMLYTTHFRSRPSRRSSAPVCLLPQQHLAAVGRQAETSNETTAARQLTARRWTALRWTALHPTRGLWILGLRFQIPIPASATGADGVCIFCSDEEWHCGGHVAPQCPPGVGEGGQCAGVVVNAGDCVTCGSDGGGDDRECIGNMPKDGYWKPSSCPMFALDYDVNAGILQRTSQGSILGSSADTHPRFSKCE